VASLLVLLPCGAKLRQGHVGTIVGWAVTAASTPVQSTAAGFETGVAQLFYPHVRGWAEGSPHLGWILSKLRGRTEVPRLGALQVGSCTAG
jgi:hypothetical protein